MNPEEIREDFPIFQKRDVKYLDNAATTQKPERVIKAVEKFYEKNNSNVGRGLYTLANDASAAYSEARESIAEFIGASADEIVFVRNTTEAYNLVAESLDFNGDIVVGEMAHHSEQLPLRRNADEYDKELKFIETENGRLSVESAGEKIDDSTGLVSISHMSNVYGAENPVEEIVEQAKEHDAIVLLDAAQSVPRMPVDVDKLDIDLMAFSGHKMLGPTGIGVLYGRKHILEQMSPYQVGGGMIDSVEKESVDYASSPEKFEAGTPNTAGAIGLGAAVEYLQQFDMEDVKNHDVEMTAKMIEGLKEVDGIEVLSPKKASLVSFTADWAHPHDIAEILNQNEVAVRAGYHCAQPEMQKMDLNGTTRASPYIYTTEKDIEKFLSAVKEAKKVFDSV